MACDEGLEGQTLEIVRSQHSPLRVIAGPGTGKTYALMRRLARLLKEGTEPSRICLVTFTRVSAQDLEEELRKLGLAQAERVDKGTLHALCFRLLAEANVLRFTERTPRPLLEFEERFLLEDLAQYGEFGDLNSRRRRLKAFEAAWAREQDQIPGWPTNEIDQDLQNALDEWLQFHDAMLIDEIVPETLRYLRANPGCEELSRYDHVLVDEYQDLNRAEQSVIDLLAARASLAVVGDQDQAIYESFRYAHPESISEFHESHPGTYDVPLDVSRRCPSAIVSLANALIRSNSRRSKRRLVPTDDDRAVAVRVVQWPDMESEAKGLARHIAARVLVSEEYVPGKTLVLCPRRQFGYLIRDELVAQGVDAHSFFHDEALDGNPKRLGESAAQQAFTLLTLLAHPADQVALRAWLGFGDAILRRGEYKHLRDCCSGSKLSTWGALAASRAGGLTMPNICGAIRRFDELQSRLDDLGALAPNEAFDRLFPGDEAWAAPFRSMYDQASGGLTHRKAHELIRAGVTQPDLPRDVPYIRVMSLHKSKGLTADNVFVTGCVEGIIPSHSRHALTFEEQRRYLEEQRRLFYVAITRARRTLVLSSVLSLPRDMAHTMGARVHGGDRSNGNTIASTFLSELGPTCPRAEWGPSSFH